MNSDFTEDIDSCFDLNEFAVSATYKLYGARTGAVIPIIFDYGKRFAVDGETSRETGEIELRVSDVSKPKYQDTITLGSDVWQVMRVVSGDDLTWKVEVEKQAYPVFAKRS
jgi:hypothetical protein